MIENSFLLENLNPVALFITAPHLVDATHFGDSTNTDKNEHPNDDSELNEIRPNDRLYTALRLK